MTKILAGALALALLAGSAAVAQPNVGHDQPYGHGDQGDHRGDHRGDHGWDHRGRGHVVCTWRHHHRVCYRRGW